MKEHCLIKSNFDNLPLDVLVFRPDHPKGIIQFAHGMCEHKERYEEFMGYLCQQGYVCLIHDHRGHGKSILHQEDLGYFYTNGNQAIVEDVHQLTDWIKKQYPQMPIYLFGHSMGSLVVRCYMKKYDDDIDGLIVCGNPSYNPAATLGVMMTRFLSHIKNDRYHSSLIQHIGFEAFNRQFDKKIPNSWICSNQDVVKKYNQDPLCSFTFTTNGFECLFLLMQETYSHKSWQLKHKDIPILFIAGKEDPCIISPKKFENAYMFMKKLGYSHITAHLFDKMRHEILNETQHQKVYSYITKTLKSWEK